MSEDFEEYKALIHPDAYDYLEELTDDALQNDPMLSEQEESEDSKLFGDDYDEDEETEMVDEEKDESSQYDGDLFSIQDNLDAEYDEDDHETIEESCPEDEEQDKGEELMFEDDENDDLLVAGEEKKADKLPSELLNEIMEKISKYSPVKVFFNECSEDQLYEIEEQINLTKQAWMVDGKDKMFSIPEACLTFAVIKDTEDPMTEIQRAEAIAVTMVANMQETWSAVYLYFDENGFLKDARDRQVNKSLFTERQWKTIDLIAKKYADQL